VQDQDSGTLSDLIRSVSGEHNPALVRLHGEFLRCAGVRGTNHCQRGNAAQNDPSVDSLHHVALSFRPVEYIT
jgi:hypothetical protein